MTEADFRSSIPLIEASQSILFYLDLISFTNVSRRVALILDVIEGTGTPVQSLLA